MANVVAVRTWWLSYAAALVAVALLSFAGVRSTVMQTQMSVRSETPGCGMARMPMGGARKSGPAVPTKSCPYCAVAAHTPVCDDVPPLAPSTAVAWVSWPPVNSLGTRGPPAREARARGPPSTPLIA